MLVYGIRRQGHGFCPVVGQCIGSHDTGTAGIGEDGQSGPTGTALAGENLGRIEKFFEGFDPNDAGPLERCIVDRIFTGHGAGVRSGGNRAGPAPSGL